MLRKSLAGAIALTTTASAEENSEWNLLHNYYRCLHHSPAITWDESLLTGDDSPNLLIVVGGDNYQSANDFVYQSYLSSFEQGSAVYQWFHATTFACSQEDHAEGGKNYTCRYAGEVNEELFQNGDESAVEECQKKFQDGYDILMGEASDSTEEESSVADVEEEATEAVATTEGEAAAIQLPERDAQHMHHHHGMRMGGLGLGMGVGMGLGLGLGAGLGYGGIYSPMIASPIISPYGYGMYSPMLPLMYRKAVTDETAAEITDSSAEEAAAPTVQFFVAQKAEDSI